MSAVPLHQALFWPGDSPVSRSGAVDFEALARCLARADYWAPLHGRFGPLAVPQPPAGRKPDAGRSPLAGRSPYSRAQHAVVASRAVETLATLKVPQRRVLAMHAWLAELRNAELSGAPGRGAVGGKKRLALRFMELEALADVLARTVHWRSRPGSVGKGASGATETGASPRRATPPGATLSGAAVAGAAEVDELLVRLAELGATDRNRIALHALFCELLPSGLGPMAADAVLRAAGLDGEVPESWVEILRFIRRVADETARRDAASGARIERTGFPALDMKIEPLDEDAAARLWLQRHKVLSEAGQT